MGLTLALPQSDASAGDAPPPNQQADAPEQGGDGNGNGGNDGNNGDGGPGEDGEDDGGVAGDGGAFAASGGAVAAASESAPLEGWSPASAGEPYDLAVNVQDYEFGSVNKVRYLVVWAENRGSEDAHGVEVLLDRANPLTGKVYYKFRIVGDNDDLDGVVNYADADYVALDSGRGVWRIGSLPAGSRIGMEITPGYEWTGNANDEPPRTTGTSLPGRIVAPLTAEISNPRHRDPLPENNKDAAWMVIRKNYLQFRALSAFNTLLEAQAGNLRPANNDGQAVNFTLKLENLGTTGLVTRGDTYHTLLSDVTLDVTLSGLKVKTAPTTAELNGTAIQCRDSDTAQDTLGACADGDDSAQWDIGFLYGYSPDDLKCDSTATGEYVCRQLTLKLALDGNMPLAERCLEARVRSLPAPEGWQGGPIKVCLGADDPPRLLLEDGQVDLFTLYPCVGSGRTAYPCNSDDTDSLEIVSGAYLPTDYTRRSDILGDPTNANGPRNWNDGKAVLQTGYTTATDPEIQAFIQVKDPNGRYFDGQTTESLNGAAVVSWHTARNPDYAWDTTNPLYSFNKTVDVPGAHLALSAAPFYDERTDWGKMTRLTGVGGLKSDGSLPPQANIACAVPTNAVLPTGLPTLPLAPGGVHMRQMFSGYMYGNHKTDYVNYPWFKRRNIPNLENARNIRPYDQFFEFEKLGTYVLYYHVSGIRSSAATLKPSQTFCDTARYVFHVGPVADLAVKANSVSSGYSVSAMNHGPDPAENAQVKLNVTGAQNAKASVGCFDPATGVWGLSQELKSGKCVDVEYTRLPDDPDPRFHPGDTATLTFTGNYGSITADIYNKEQCVNNEGAVQSATTELACIYSDTTATPPTRSGNHWGSYEVCVDYDSANKERTADAIYVSNNVRQAITSETDCTAASSAATWDVGTVYDYDERNNSATLGRAPGAVGSVSASRDRTTPQTTINVTWTAPGGSPAPTGYDVEYQWRAGNSGAWSGWVRAATETTGTTYALTSAGGGNSYRFQVRAVTASNPDNLTGSWRTSNTVATVAGPGQVTNLTAARKSGDDTTINVTWAAPSGGTTPTGYNVQYRYRTGNSGAWNAWANVPGRTVDVDASLSYDLTGATGARSYQFQVQTFTTSGSTSYGTWLTTRIVTAAASPGQVSNLTATRQSDETTILVSWTNPANAANDTYYQVEYQQDNGAWGNRAANVTASPYTLLNAAPGSKYVFRVRAVTPSGDTASQDDDIYGSWRTSNTVRGLTVGDVASVTATRNTSDLTRIDLTWATANRATGYDVEYRKNSGSWQRAETKLGIPSQGPYYTQTNAGGVESYTFRVRGVSDAGNGAWEVSDPVGPPPLQYQGVVVGVDYVTVNVTSGPWWYKYQAHDGWTSCAQVAAGGSHTITNLMPERAYRVDLFKTSACNWNDSSDNFQRVHVTTLSDVNDWGKCWNTTDCRSIDNPNDFNNHTHKRQFLAAFGVTTSGCDWNTRKTHSHGWPDGGHGPHWHCETQ